MGPCAGGLSLTPPSGVVRDGNGEVRVRVLRFFAVMVSDYGSERGSLIWSAYLSMYFLLVIQSLLYFLKLCMVYFSVSWLLSSISGYIGYSLLNGCVWREFGSLVKGLGFVVVLRELTWVAVVWRTNKKLTMARVKCVLWWNDYGCHSAPFFVVIIMNHYS